MIPFIDFGGSGPALFFSHGNGYPPQTYTPLLNALTAHYRVRAIQFRPLWPGAQPNGLRDWNPFADDVIRWIVEQAETDVIGMGHSLGAIATLAAALRRPELFRAVILLDPVLLYRRLLYVWTVLRKLGLAHVVHPLIPSTKRRRRIFANHEEMFARYRSAPVFTRLSDEALRVYMDALTRARPDGQIELAYSPEWEVAIYTHGPLNLWGQLARLRPPLLIIRGEHSDTFHPPAMRQVLARLPQAQIITVPDAGHLVPMEKPEEVARHSVEFLETATREL